MGIIFGWEWVPEQLKGGKVFDLDESHNGTMVIKCSAARFLG
jgi:hypothetical protein